MDAVVKTFPKATMPAEKPVLSEHVRAAPSPSAEKKTEEAVRRT